MPAPRKAAAPKPKTPIGRGSDADFTFESTLGPITVPSLAKVDIEPNGLDFIDVLATEDPQVRDARQMKMILEAAVPADVMPVVRRLKIGELYEFMAAWNKHSGIGPGESPAS